MKKFLKVRNVVIIAIIIIAIAFVVVIRKDNVTESKAYKYLDNIRNSSSGYTYTLETENFKALFAIDNEKNIKVMSSKGWVPNQIDQESEMSQTMILVNDKLYSVDHINKEYHEIGNGDLPIIDIVTHLMPICNYYTIGYGFIDGKLLYVEHFKTENGSARFYFDNDKIAYIKFNDELDTFKVEKGVSEDLYRIPSDYKKIEEME